MRDSPLILTGNNGRIFLLQVPLTLVSFLMVSFILDGRHKSSTSWLTKLKRIDYPGTLALISAIFTLLFGLSWGSNHAWNSALTLGCLGSSLILFATFLIVEAKLVAEPIAPIHIICKPTLFACYLSHFFSHAAFMAMLYYIPLFFQAATGLSATQAGLRLMPTVVASICGSIIAGVVMQTSGRYYLLNLYGYTFLVLGLLLVLLTTGLDYVSAWFIIGLVIAGYAQGSTSTSTFIAISMSFHSPSLSRSLFPSPDQPKPLFIPHQITKIKSTSLQRVRRRTAHRHRLFLSLPLPRLRRRYLHLRLHDAAVPAHGTARVTEERRGRRNHRRARSRKPGVHQHADAERRAGRPLVLW